MDPDASSNLKISDTDSMMSVVASMRPQASPFPLVRIGGKRDGAYLLPDDLDGISACFSPGVSNIKPFEDELANRYSIASHLCDYSSDLEALFTPLIDGMQTFEKKWLDLRGNEDAHCLEDWVNRHAPDLSSDLMLQIDIEGAEYRNLLSTPIETLQRFRIIVIELHGLKAMQQAAVLSKVFEPLFAILDSTFTCVHAHPNNCCGDFRIPGTETRVPHVIELTYLRNDRILEAPEAERFPVEIPHSLDLVNVSSERPLFLDDSWVPGERPIKSRLTIIEARLNWVPTGDTTVSADGVRELFFLTARALADIRIAEPDDDSVELLDLSDSKPYRLSSSYSSTKKTGRIKAALPYFFHTSAATEQYITVDLETEARLYQLILENRQDGWQDRAAFLFYVTHKEPNADLSLGLPVCITDKFLNKSPSPCLTSLDGVSARYVTIFSPVKTCLHLSSIQILGHTE